MSHVWEIPDGFELVGFHAGMNANDEIVWLGIVTRVAIFPAVCFEAVNTIRQGVYAINDLNVVISDMSSDVQRQVGAMESDVNEQFVQMNKDVEEQLGAVETSIEATVAGVETYLSEKILEVNSIFSDLTERIN